MDHLMRRTAVRLACCGTIFCAIAASVSVGRAVELVDLKLDAPTRKYNPENRVQRVEQEFAVTEPGILTVEYVATPWQSQNGGAAINTKDGSPFTLGRLAYETKTPPDGPKYHENFSRLQRFVVPKAIDKRLVASITAFFNPQAFQVYDRGDQVGASQTYKVSLTPSAQALTLLNDPPAIDIAGTWYYAAGGRVVITPKGNGLYDFVEHSHGNGKGTAKVSGRTVIVHYTNTISNTDFKSAILVLQVGAKNDVMAGSWLADNGQNADTALVKDTSTPPKPDSKGTPTPTPTPTATPTPTPTTPAGGGGKGAGPSTPPTSTGRGAKPPSEPPAVAQMTLVAGKRRVRAGQTITVPVWLLKTTAVANMNFNLVYDKAVAKSTGAFDKGNLVDNSKTMVEVNPKEEGIVRFGFARNSDLAGDGTLVQLPFTATGAVGSRTALRLEVTTISSAAGTKPAIATIDGEILVVGPDGEIPGDSDGDGQWTARDAANALKMSVKLIPVNMVCDMDKDGQVTSTDARLILAKAAGKP